ncbi:MAG: hypothetical protein ABWZ66_09115 [Pyrinomonadaceae bacterium]
MKRCPECNSEKIIEDAKGVDRADYMTDYGFKVKVDGDPDAVFFKGAVYSEVDAKICADCGCIRFYAVSARQLRTAYKNRQKDVS